VFTVSAILESIGYLVTLTLILTLTLTLLNPINPNRDSKTIKTASVGQKLQNGHLFCFVCFAYLSCLTYKIVAFASPRSATSALAELLY